MKTKILMILILMIAIVSGCVNNGKTVYYSKKSNETITLYNDNTLTSSYPSGAISGVYRIDDGYLIATFPPFGTVVKRKISGKSLVDEKDGETWVRI